MPDPLMTELERHAPAAPARDEIDLLDIALLVSARRQLYGKILIIAFVVITTIAYLLPVQYTATAKVLPPQNQSGGLQTMILSQLAGSTGGGGGLGSMLGGALNIKSPSDVYIAMLKSRTLEDRIIDKFDLKSRYGVKTYIQARKALEDRTDIRSGKEGLVTIEFDDKDPVKARDITKAYVDNLMQLSEELAISEAGQRRQYFERELSKEKDRLADAEVELKKIQQASGLIVPNEQARAVVESIARLQAMIAAKEVQIGAMRNFAAPGNAELNQAERELSGLRDQLTKLQRNQGQASEGDIFVSSGKLPETTLQFMRKYRDFKYHETIYELLAKQFEIAKLEESRDYAGLQVLDWPVVPDRKSKPVRTLIILFTMMFISFAIVVHALLTEQHRIRMRNPAYAARIERLQSLWKRS